MARVSPNVSHDQFTRFLHKPWNTNWLLHFVLRFLFRFQHRWLALDDTIFEKPYSKRTYETFWAYSHTKKKPVFGVCVVWLVWSNGHIRLPLGFRVWKKGGPSKIDLGLELLSYARNQLKLTPEMVLFDSWYPAKRLLKRLNQYGWMFICQVKKNRRFQELPACEYQRNPYWNAKGRKSCGTKVLLVRHRKKYVACNRLSLSAKEVRARYQRRQDVEEVIRCLKSQLSVQSCQVGYRRRRSEKKPVPKHGPQAHHIALCAVAYLICEFDRQGTETSWRKYRQLYIFLRWDHKSPALNRLKLAA